MTYSEHQDAVEEFNFEIDHKDTGSSEYMWHLHTALAKVALEAMRRDGLTRKKIADKLGVDKAVVTRILNGGANPTARTVGELLWAIGAKPAVDFTLIPKSSNGYATTDRPNVIRISPDITTGTSVRSNFAPKPVVATTG
ncbi:helix-turn-helix domain-containing protein [Tropicimonas marinistellae]|uniref:helix-turn-helix domain-containing protein n=1 Tax=Tropicimonas marinistellae TaxID=1739787 RepID=UPI00082D176E|nr:helix-turn-helix transcriptional regulator [Tropicimonas marinistellae]